MNWKLFATVFSTVFIAELGDKTQLATLLYAGQAKNPKLMVFAASASALVAACAIGVLAGSYLSGRCDPKILTRVAGAGFIVLGIWTLVKA